MKKLSTYHQILVGIVLLLTVIFFFILMNNSKEEEKLPESKELYEVSENESGQASVEVSPEELKKIRLWIRDNNLDEYGNPEGTIYAGGNPLFDGKNGETMLIYDYLLKNHPDKPWQNYFEKNNSDEEVTENPDSEDKSSIKAGEKNIVEMSFSDIKEWKILSKESYDIEYPEFVKIEEQNNFIKLSGEEDFLMYIYIDNRDKDLSSNFQCDQLDLIDINNASICHNDSIKYKQIYQRVKDSVIAK